MFLNPFSADIWLVCKFSVSWPSFYDNACVCLEQEESLCSNELFWASEFPSAIPALGSYGLFTATGKFHNCGSPG